MSVNAISTSTPITIEKTQAKKVDPEIKLNFASDSVELSTNKEAEETKEATETKEASLPRRIIGGISSLFLAGSGQFIKGEGKKGAKFLLTEVGGAAAAGIGINVALKSKSKAGAIAGLAVAGLSAIGCAINSIVSSVDAFKKQND